MSVVGCHVFLIVSLLMLYIVNLKVKDMMVVMLFMNDLKLYSVWAIIVNKIMLCVCRSE